MSDGIITINGKQIPINGERSILELAKKAGIDIPTFCNHADLSVYGACRLCLVDIDGRIVTSCTTKPQDGMKVLTNTDEIRKLRKVALELILADHNKSCPTCDKNNTCELQKLTRVIGVENVRFKPTRKPRPIDNSSDSLTRDPSKCVLCGNCVRACNEVQGIGVLDFAKRGSNAYVTPCLDKPLSEVDCVLCGRCAAVCPTGAILPKNEIEKVMAALNDPTKKTVVHMAPAVRVSLGEAFGEEPGEVLTNKIAACLRMLGFDLVFDTSFSADLTIVEEATEFVNRVIKGEKLPQFTSCCPAWVRYVELFYPDLKDNLSSCRSPMQMFGGVIKDALPGELGVEKKDIFNVAIMPCTAKKHEAALERFTHDGIRDTDVVLTTQELAQMIEGAGINFKKVAPDKFDKPFGDFSGGGVIFGVTGGVTEAALRFAVEKLTGEKLQNSDFVEVRGQEGIRTAQYTVAGKTIRLALVSGLANAKKVCDEIRAGKCNYDLIEVMACPGGCINGAGQIRNTDFDYRQKRSAGIYNNDKSMELRNSQDNPDIKACYEKFLGEIGGEKAHHLLHTYYHSQPTSTSSVDIFNTGKKVGKVSVKVSLAGRTKEETNLLSEVLNFIDSEKLQDKVYVEGTFFLPKWEEGVNVEVNGITLSKADINAVKDAIKKAI